MRVAPTKFSTFSGPCIQYMYHLIEWLSVEVVELKQPPPPPPPGSGHVTRKREKPPSARAQSPHKNSRFNKYAKERYTLSPLAK